MFKLLILGHSRGPSGSQVAVAIGVSFTPLFDMNWGHALPMVVAILLPKNRHPLASSQQALNVLPQVNDVDGVRLAF